MEPGLILAFANRFLRYIPMAAATLKEGLGEGTGAVTVSS